MSFPDVSPLRINKAKDIGRLHQRKFRQELGLYIVEGSKGVAEALASPSQVECIVASQEWIGEHPEATAATPCFIATDMQLKALSQLATPPGCLAVICQVKAELSIVQSYVYCDGIADPGNMGTIIRTADWFGVKGIILGANTVDAYNPKTVQAAMGSLFRADIIGDAGDCLPMLAAAGYDLIATDQHATRGMRKNGAPFCLLMGSESHGLSAAIRQKATIFYGIPQIGGAESLNVGAATGAILYDLCSLQLS